MPWPADVHTFGRATVRSADFSLESSPWAIIGNVELRFDEAIAKRIEPE